MGASIENREPFEDYRLYCGVFSLPDRYFQTKGKGKWLLMNSIGKKLPGEITNHRKIGLSIPWFDHFQNSEYFKENIQTIHLSPIFQTKCFEGVDIKRLSEENLKYGHSKSIFFKMLFLHIWYKEYFKD
jgi:asparagine synthase (glutamine-hydrolysing)